MRIVSYTPEYEPALLELERESPQGKHLQLEMVRSSLLDRSRVFDDFEIFIILGEEDLLVGMAAASVTEVELNGDCIPAGFCYDLRIKPEYRRQGISKMMGRYVIRHFFQPRGIRRYFLTMKKTNAAVQRSVQSVLGLAHTYRFQYLTVPASRVVSDGTDMPAELPAGELRFAVRVSNPKTLPEGWYRALDRETGLFATHRMYQIKVVRVAASLKWGIRLSEWYRGESNTMPRQDEVMKFATLCHSGVPDPASVNGALNDLAKTDVRYLIACCRKGDPVYRMLRPAAVNDLDYLVVGNFPVSSDDTIRMDVRCL